MVQTGVICAPKWRKDHCVMFLDLAKAFDTVPHEAIEDTLYQHLNDVVCILSHLCWNPVFKSGKRL